MIGRPASLQGRLLALVLGIVLAGGVLASIAAYDLTAETAGDMFDAQLVQVGQTLMAIIEKGDDQVAYDPGTIAHRYHHKIVFQVWEQIEGRFQLILRSDNAPTFELPGANQVGFSDGRWDDHEWRVFVETDAHGDTRVVVAEDLGARKQLVAGIARQNLVPFMFGIPALAVLLLLAIRRALAPLSSMAHELEDRRPDRLDPVDLSDPPLELQPVTNALNSLFLRVEAALENERRFTSDAAHELRTPLTALLAHLQVAQRTDDPVERQRSLAKCRQSVNDITHLVDQLLTLARIESPGQLPTPEPLDVGELAEQTCLDIRPLANARGVTLDVAAARDAVASGLPDMLRILMRNLVDNAVRYTPAGGNVRVLVDRDEDGLRLEVTDDGPGVPAEKLPLLGRRFHRLDPSAGEGVGIGLSIVRRIADLHGARLTFSPAPGKSGLRATVLLQGTALS